MARWCPACGSEWWVQADACPDCDVALVDHQPPPPEPDLDPVDGRPRSHDITTVDLGQLDDAERWRVWLALDDAGITHEWDDDGRLTLPVDGLPVLEAVTDEFPGGDDRPTDHDNDIDIDVGIGEDGGVRPATTGARRAGAWLVDAALATAVIAALPWQVSYSIVAFYQLFAVRFGGRTIGKLVTHLRVEATGGGPVGWSGTLRRALVDLAPWWIALFPWPDDARNAVGLVSFIGLIVLATSTFVDPLHRGLHDRAAGTIVVRA